MHTIQKNISLDDIINMIQEDPTLEYLLELDGEGYVIDERLGLWVKFEVKKIQPTKDRFQGIRYSLTLHDRSNKRIMGFDNSHAVEYGRKINVAPKRCYDHWHRNETDDGQPYNYKSAGKLIEDFWKEVEKIVKKLEEV